MPRAGFDLGLIGLVLGAVLGTTPRPARAQCVPLAALLRAANAPAFALDSLDAYLPAGQWRRYRPNPGSHEEQYWLYRGTSPNPSIDALLPDDAEVSLRRPNQSSPFDVLLKTMRRGCLAELRGALRRAGYKAEPVNCVNCLGERYVGPTGTVTLFDLHLGYANGKSLFPFVVSVRHSGGPGGSTSPATRGTRPAD